MATKDIVTSVEEFVTPIVIKHNFDLVEVEFVREGSNWFLRIYIDKPDGISIDDCQVVSQELGKILDEVDIISQNYFLEVSSPGLERPLKKDNDFKRHSGEEVEVKIFEPLDGKKVFRGILKGIINDKIVISKNSEENMEFERSKVANVKRVIKF